MDCYVSCLSGENVADHIRLVTNRTRSLLHSLCCPQSARSSLPWREQGGLLYSRRRRIVSRVRSTSTSILIVTLLEEPCFGENYQRPAGGGLNQPRLTVGLCCVAINSKIVDDGYEHTIMVMRDQRTARMRLLTVVAEGELKQCPVWTAFGAYTPLTLNPNFYQPFVFLSMRGNGVEARAPSD